MSSKVSSTVSGGNDSHGDPIARKSRHHPVGGRVRHHIEAAREVVAQVVEIAAATEHRAAPKRGILTRVQEPRAHGRFTFLDEVARRPVFRHSWERANYSVASIVLI